MKHPEQIDKYLIKGVLGQGAMGVVYAGEDPSLDRQVAIKTIRLDQGQDLEASSTRFLQEAKTLAQCNHPNIVTMLDFGQDQGLAYMVMEFIQGSDLGAWVKRQKTLKLKAVIGYFVQLLKALNVAHSKGVIHRDLKPENVLMVNQQLIKLTDFGIAKTQTDSGQTQIGMAVGTPKYMAPEQMFGTDEVGVYTDLYALFVMLCDWLNKVPASEQLLKSPLPNLEDRPKHNQFDPNATVPDVMIPFLSKGLSSAPQERDQSVQEVVKELKPILHKLKDHANQTNTGDADETSGYFSSGTIITQSSDRFQLSEVEFADIRDDLANLVGPMADFIINHAMKNSHNHDQFIVNVAQKIDQADVREGFLDRWRTF